MELGLLTADWQTYMIAGLTFLAIVVAFRIIQGILEKQLERIAARTRTDIDDTVAAILKAIKPPVYIFLALYLTIESLTVTPLIHRVITVITIIAITYQCIIFINILIDVYLRRRLTKTQEESTRAVITFTGQMAKIGLWLTGLLFILSNVGVNILSLIAGLGVGGIAIALAAQNVLGDLFSSLALYIDKPFNVGDFIVVDDIKGTVKHIGIKTTRLLALEGEEIIMSNRELTADRIKNYQRMTQRRVIFTLALASTTPPAKIRQIPHLLQEIIEGVPTTQFKSAHLISIDNGRLTFEVTYFMLVRSHSVFLDTQQEINVRLLEQLHAHHIQVV